jgi:hypothetical protein
MIRTFARLSATFAVVFAVSGAHAGDNSYLKTFAGQWRGTGAIRTAGDSPQEKLVCRIDGELDGAGDQLELSGRCGGERFNGSFTIYLSYNSAAGNYSAVWRDSLGGKSPTLTGLKSGDRLVFKVRHNDFETDGRAVSTLVVDPAKTGFHIIGHTLPATGAIDFISADLIFVRG